jgi:putative glutathione S-transferase
MDTSTPHIRLKIRETGIQYASTFEHTHYSKTLSNGYNGHFGRCVSKTDQTTNHNFSSMLSIPLASRSTLLGLASFGSRSPFLTGGSIATTALRSVVTTADQKHFLDGSRMTTNLPEFVLEKDRYRLYVAISCPFAHRVRLVRLLHGLEDSIDLTFVTGQGTEGFSFDKPEPEFGATTLMEVYRKANLPTSYEGKATVPMIVDKTTHKMASKESLESSFALATQCSDDTVNLLPDGAEALAQDLDSNVTNAIYKFLFIPTIHKQNVAEALWAEFDKYDKLLESQPYLLGDKLSFPDCILWATVIRFDNVYARQFGLKGKTIRQDYPNLAKFAERVWKVPSKRGDTTLGEDANLPEVTRLYWQSSHLAAQAGNDPTSPPPEILPVF